MDTERIAKLEIQVESIKEDVAEVKSDIKELHSRITTGNREIMDKMDQIDERIETKMNQQAAVNKEQHEIIHGQIRDELNRVSNRVTSLEHWKWYVIGAAAIIGFLISNFTNLSKILG